MNNSADSDNLLTERPWKLKMGRREEERRKVETEKKDLASVERLSESESEEEEESEEDRKKFRCVFFKFKDGPLLYSLYAYVIATSDFIKKRANRPPPPSPLVTILNIPRNGKFPIGMACVELGSRIYFIGGQCRHNDKSYASKKVYYLDCDTFTHKELSPTSSSSGSGGSLINYDELSECPNMHGGKCNPIVMAANGKLYVLSGLICGDFNNRTFGSSPEFNVTDWSWMPSDELICGDLNTRTVSFQPDFNVSSGNATFNVIEWDSIYNSYHEWLSCAFEVYDPVTDEWERLPLPGGDSSSPILPGYCSGHAVIHDKIFLCCWAGRVHTFDLKTQKWKLFDSENISKTQTETYDDNLARALVRNPLIGRGLVLKDTLYAFALCNKRLSTFSAYHIPDNLEDTSISRTSLGFISPYPFKRDSESGLYALQAGFFYLGNGNFCSVFHVFPEIKYTEHNYQEPLIADAYFGVFEVVLKRTCRGDISWSTQLPLPYKVQQIDADSGSILDFFTL